MKYTRKRYAKQNSKNRRQHKSKRQLKHRYKRKSRHRSRRRLKQKGGSNGLIQLGYNTTRGMTSTIKNFINTFRGDTLSASPQATKNQYFKQL